MGHFKIYFSYKKCYRKLVWEVFSIPKNTMKKVFHSLTENVNR